jgi:hypothetical protein
MSLFLKNYLKIKKNLKKQKPKRNQKRKEADEEAKRVFAVTVESTNSITGRPTPTNCSHRLPRRNNTTITVSLSPSLGFQTKINFCLSKPRSIS